MRQSRVFVPSVTHRSIRRWVWSRNGGLKVEYLDGLTLKSDWGSLPEFLRAVRDGREVGVVES